MDKNKRLEIFFDSIIVLIVILLYIFVGMFLYTDFRERKRNEISKDIIKKVDEKIENTEEIIPEENGINTQYSGINYTVIGKIRVKKIGIYQPILKENTKAAYDASAVKMSGPNLNTNGNVAIGGHNFMRGRFFIKINKLVNNDVITITDLSGDSVDYYVYEYGIRSIDDVSYLAQPDDPSLRIVTLVTCTKGGKERYYVKAKAK